MFVNIVCCFVHVKKIWRRNKGGGGGRERGSWGERISVLVVQVLVIWRVECQQSWHESLSLGYIHVVVISPVCKQWYVNHSVDLAEHMI